VWLFKNPNFVRDEPEKLGLIERRAPKKVKSSSRSKTDPKSEPKPEPSRPVVAMEERVENLEENLKGQNRKFDTLMGEVIHFIQAAQMRDQEQTAPGPKRRRNK